jgi:long-chain fatty acid transport protein
MKTYAKFHMRSHKVFLLLLLVLLYPATGYSLDSTYWNTQLGFQFYPPGARALGMGGAFVGLADDATAAASNPAGIAQLTHMQLAIEGRYVTKDSTGKTFPWTALGGTSGIQRTSSDVNDATDVSFGAFTTPVFNNLFNIALFYDKPMSFSVNKFMARDLGGQLGEFQPSSTDITIHEAGLSIAKSFFDGKLMLGGGLGIQFLDMQQHVDAFTVDTLGAATRYFSRSVDQNDVGISYRAGVLVKPIDKLRLGASYTLMPRFEYHIRQDFVGSTPELFNSQFDVPDNLSLGAAYNILPNWVVLFEARYLMYSQLEKSFVIPTAYPDAPVYPNGRRIFSSQSDYSIDDIWEIHFGTEYVLNAIQNVPIALRAGVFYEPAHDLKYTKPSIIADAANRPGYQLNNIEAGLFDGGQDLWHFTFGTGAVFFNHFQVDVGADLTEKSRNVTVSMVYQF